VKSPASLLRDERATTLVELMVSMAILSVVSIILLTGLFSANKIETYTSQDSQTLTSLRVSMERFEKELRGARKVYDDSTATKVHFWLDFDRDNQQDLSERITWEVTAAGDGANLTRKTDADSVAIVVGEGFLLEGLFSYAPAPPDTTLVIIDFVADVSPTAHATERRIHTEVRLRNANAE
jgi:type II secretory pathway pseudopilin PulG